MPTRKRAPEPTLKLILEGIERLDARFDEMQGATDARFGEMDARFGDLQGSLDARFGAILGTMDSRFVDMDSRLQGLQGTMDSRLGEMQGAMDAGFLEMQAVMDGRLEEMGIKVDSQALLLEDMRAQNRATIEAVETSRQALEEKVESLTRDTNQRIGVLDDAIQHLARESRAADASLDLAIRDLKVTVQQNSLDIRDLAGKVEALTRLEERVAALERRLV